MKEIRNIISLYQQLPEAEKAALATVVHVEDSSYRRVGARMLVTESGQYVGGISGGCLEGDALRRAKTAILKNTPSVVTYDTRDGDNHQIGVGLGCEGKIDVLFTPLNETDKHPIRVLESLTHQRHPTVLMQVVGKDLATIPEGMNGLLYTVDDAVHLAEDYGFHLGDVTYSIELVMDFQRSQSYFILGKAQEHYKVLFEYIRPETRLIIVGDNYDITPLAHIAHEMGWIIEVVGLRRKFNKSVYALANEVRSYQELSAVSLDASTCVVLMTHDYDKDLLALRHFLPLQPAYLGLLGPRKRMDKLHQELLPDGLDLREYPHLYSPVGLEVGAETPEEIAVSILAEMIAAMREKSGGMLRDRVGPIHT
ncbi:MAG: XdhC family protein [Bacteroidota bacterium]